jgi:hypothetical protein
LQIGPKQLDRQKDSVNSFSTMPRKLRPADRYRRSRPAKSRLGHELLEDMQVIEAQILAGSSDGARLPGYCRVQPMSRRAKQSVQPRQAGH